MASASPPRRRRARLIVSQTIVEALDALDMRFPELDDDEQRELRALRRQLSKGKIAKN
jgi:hypothetical protein